MINTNSSSYKRFKTGLWVVFFMVIINALLFGYNNFEETQRKNQYQQYEFYSIQAEDGDEQTEAKVKILEKEINQEPSSLQTIIRALNVSLLSMLTVVLGAMVFAMFHNHYQVVSLRDQVKRKRRKLGKIELEHDQWISTLQKMYALHSRIQTLLKEILALRKKLVKE